MYILLIYTWYTLYLPYIYYRYTMYIHGIYVVYTKDNPWSIYKEYSLYITGMSEPCRYIHGIYMVYTWYMKCICRPDRYVRYIPSEYLMGLFRTFFYNDIPVIHHVYFLNTHSISLSFHIPFIYHLYIMYMLYIYHVYTNSPSLISIYHVYIMYT